MSQQNIQILLETFTKCAGNCSGCALTSIERSNDINLDSNKLNNYKKITDKYLSQYNPDNVESISIFLGQGDHFLIKDEDIYSFVEFCASLVPNELKHKTVIFITASAIGKHENIKRKMDIFYEHSVKLEIPLFIQVVFDPKKMIVSDKFREIYIKNILYLKQKCGMIEFTINLGNDLTNHITPQEFHDLVKLYNINHVEMNWVINSQTYPMWINSYKDMFKWLKEWLSIYKEDKKYEINFIPFLGRAFLKNNIEFSDLKPYIFDSLIHNLYIDTNENFSLGQMGIISNITPIKERLLISDNSLVQLQDIADKEATNIIKKINRNKTCASCEYKNLCALSSSTIWFDYKDNEDKNSCPWSIKDFLDYLYHNFFNINDSLGNTIFNKNPVQNLSMLKDKNATHTFFDEKI